MICSTMFYLKIVYFSVEYDCFVLWYFHTWIQCIQIITPPPRALVGCFCSSGWPYNHAHTESSNWIHRVTWRRRRSRSKRRKRKKKEEEEEQEEDEDGIGLLLNFTESLYQFLCPWNFSVAIYGRVMESKGEC